MKVTSEQVGDALRLLATGEQKNVREIIVGCLGAKCEQCGYDRYTGALMITHPEYKELRKGKNRDRYMLEVLSALSNDDRWGLLCRNCQFENMQNVRQQKRQVDNNNYTGLWVWKTDQPSMIGDTFMSFDNAVNEGKEIFVLIESSNEEINGVYRYGEKEKLFDTWEEATQRLGIEPIELSFDVNRIWG